MKYIFPLLLITNLFAFNLCAAEAFHPKPFPVEGGLAVFPDYKEVKYEVTVDALTKTMAVKAFMIFTLSERGFPVFDSYNNPSSIVLNGLSERNKRVKTPEGESVLRIVTKALDPGLYSMEIVIKPKQEMCRDDKSNLLNCFLMLTDNEPRGFLEYFFPASFEFDQVKMKMEIKILNHEDEVRIYTNGNLTKSGEVFHIDLPGYFNSSSTFLHIVSAKNVIEETMDLASIDGRVIPVTAYYLKSDEYGSKEVFKQILHDTKKYFDDAEAYLGAYPHENMIIYNDGGENTGTGMEHAGAMITDLVSLNHEILHLWIGRGVMPANGNAGWIDESLVSWIDMGSQKYEILPDYKYGQSTMPYYQRENGHSAYNSFGFFGYLDYIFTNKGGLKTFLKDFIERRKHTLYTNEDFIDEMNKFYGQNLGPLFKEYTAQPYVKEE